MKINTMNYTISTGALAAVLVLSACGTKKTEPIKNAVLSQYTTINTDYFDKNTRPQDDFFQYANGAWCKANPVPDNESRWGSFNELDQANKAKLRTILEDAAKDNSVEGSVHQILGDYYTSFIDFETRNKLGLSPIKEEIELIQEISDKKQLPALIGKMHRDGIGVFYRFGVGQNMKDVDNNIASFYQGGISLPNKEYYTNKNKSDELASFEEHIRKVFEHISYSPDNLEATANSVVQFERRLAESMMAPAELRNPEKTYNKRSKVDLEQLMGSYSFATYLKALDMAPFDSLVVGQLDFAENVGRMFEDIPLEDWKNYLTWKVVDQYAGHLDHEMLELNFDFYMRVLRGTKNMKPPEEQVIEELTRMDIGEWLGRAFVEKHFSVEAKDRVNSMVDNLLIVYRERINNLEWMTAETKVEALNKLNSIGRKLGYPDIWKDYSYLNFKPNTYLENLKEATRFSVRENLNKLNLKVDKKEWGMPAHMVNAYYHPLLNEIAFPAGIMQPPFFDPEAEDAVNYGSIGMVIGHEFTHGFDDMGSQFAADGSFTNWWSDADKKAFEERTTKFGKTYETFCPIDGHCVNPQLTMGENIADLGGLTMAYYAYMRTVDAKSGIKREGFTPAQRFFLSYAQLWKINYTDEELKNRIANDPHSPGMYRVNGPLMNCPEFFSAFNVKEGDKMKNKKEIMVTIW
jgi:putative endopeptidase